MPLVTFKDLCVDVNDLRTGLDFWAPTLGLHVVPDGDDPSEFHLEGPTPRHTVWPCVVPEPKTVKNRVHLDVHAGSAEIAGATRLSAPGEFPWTVVAGPEGDELCVFAREQVPDYRLYGVGVDCADRRTLAEWWRQVWGGRLVDLREPGGAYTSLEDVPGVPFAGFAFADVPEPKRGKNRVHWDVTLEPGVGVADLVEVGSRILREPDSEISWTVMADPEGNEFCVFAEGTS